MKNQEDIYRHFDEIEKSTNCREKAILEQICTLTPGTILDYGCGHGYYSINLLNKGWNVLAVDYSKEQIELCTRVHKKNIFYNVGDELDGLESKSFDFKKYDNYFDAVLSTQTIEHVHNPGLYLDRINKMIKNGGILIISLPNILTPHHIARMLSTKLENHLQVVSNEYIKKYQKERDHINAWDPYHFTTLLASVGFRVDRFIPLEGVPLPEKIFKSTYIHRKINFIKNFSYTMCFMCTKVASSKISTYS